MLRKGTLHARQSEPTEGGGFIAVTIINRPPHGVMVWAGKIFPTAKDKSASEIALVDYETAEKVSFSHWDDVWEYFKAREYAELVAQLHIDVARLYPGE